MSPSSQTVHGNPPILVESSSVDSGVLAKIRYRLSLWRCELQGHTPMMNFEKDRLFLYCSECHLESPGWDLEGPTPHVCQPGAPDRFTRYSWLAASSALQSRAAAGDLVVF
jgi:hypothetical protein